MRAINNTITTLRTPRPAGWRPRGAAASVGRPPIGAESEHHAQRRQPIAVEKRRRAPPASGSRSSSKIHSSPSPIPIQTICRTVGALPQPCCGWRCRSRGPRACRSPTPAHQRPVDVARREAFVWSSLAVPPPRPATGSMPRRHRSRGRVLRLPAGPLVALFLVEVGLDHVPRDRRGELSVLAVLIQRGHHDFRAPARREADEPAIVV